MLVTAMHFVSALLMTVTPFRTAILPSERIDSSSGCRVMSIGDRDLLLTRAKWIAADSNASALRGLAGMSTYARDSVQVVGTSSLCDSINTSVWYVVVNPQSGAIYQFSTRW